MATRDQYLKDLEPREIEVLYRHRALLEAGVNTVVSSDGPYGPVNLGRSWTPPVNAQLNLARSLAAKERLALITPYAVIC